MSMMDYVRSKARANQKSIVLPEGTEPRTVQAAARKERRGEGRMGFPGLKFKMQKGRGEKESISIKPQYLVECN